MKATYQDFLEDNKNCSGFASNPDAERIFDFLNRDENIIKMVEFSDQGKPALAGCVLELEAFYDGLQNATVDFTDAFTRTVVGRMVKSILAPFGYGVEKGKDFPKDKKAKYFTSASCYSQKNSEMRQAATMRIVKRVEEIS